MVQPNMNTSQLLPSKRAQDSANSKLGISPTPLLRGLMIGFALGFMTAQCPGYHSMLQFDAAAAAANLKDCDYDCSIGSSTGTFGSTSTDSASVRTTYSTSSQPDIEMGLILPFERTPTREYLPGKYTDTYTFFHNYISKLGRESKNAPLNFTALPLLHIWPVYFEAYHNHWQRWRGKENLVFLEIGVQSGGKIPMLKEYFGPGLTYIGLDNNPSCKMFESADWIHIEIGDTGNRTFLQSIIQKYPKIDLFLDDGGHTMTQQRLSMEVILPHLQPDGVFICEDLSTSWNEKYEGVPWGHSGMQEFRDKTMVGLVFRSIQWLHAGWMAGDVMNFQTNHPQLNDYWKDTPWWREFAHTVKHMHVYNQLVVYEKGNVELPFDTKSVGTGIPYSDSGLQEKVQWGPVLARVQSLIKSPAW